MFYPPIPLIRKMRIIKCLTKAEAFSPETAKYLDEIGLINPYFFKRITDGRYYINR